MKLCQEYLSARGITDETVKIHGLELDERLYRLPSQTVKDRLGSDLPKSVNEIIWIPIYNADGKIVSWIARVLPTIANLGKFLCPVASDGTPYVPRTVYKLAHGEPIILTEGPIKALACAQAGFDAIGINGVWGASVENNCGLYVIRADLQNALDWRGRKACLAFDADYSIKPGVRQALIRTYFVLSVQGAEVF
jgi:hypothetical protein